MLESDFNKEKKIVDAFSECCTLHSEQRHTPRTCLLTVSWPPRVPPPPTPAHRDEMPKCELCRKLQQLGPWDVAMMKNGARYILTRESLIAPDSLQDQDNNN